MKTIRLTGLTSRKFGVELELFATRSNPHDHAAIVGALRAAGLQCEYAGYTHATTSYWKVVSDASVTTPEGRPGLELVSPVLVGEAGLKEVERACEALATIGAWISRSCGLHVHHDAADLSLDNVVSVVKLTRRFQPVFDGLVPESRRGNRFAQGWTADQVTDFARSGSLSSVRASYRGESVERYRTLNVCSLARHGTVEFRQHSGTVEARKIIPWIVLTQGIVEKAASGARVKNEQVSATGDGLDNLFRAAGLRTCLPHGQKVNPEHEGRARQATEWFSARAAEFGVIAVAQTSAARSRARAASRAAAPVATADVAADRVAAAVAAQTPAVEGAL